MDTYKSIGVRIKIRDLQKIEAEAKALELTRTAYLRMLIDRGREKIGADFAKSELAKLKDEMAVVAAALEAAPQPAAAELPLEIRELLFLLLSCAVENRAIDRNLMVKAFTQKPLDELQANLGLAMEKWRAKLGLPPAQK